MKKLITRVPVDREPAEISDTRTTHGICRLCGSTERETACADPVIFRCPGCRHAFRPDQMESVSRGYSNKVRMPTRYQALVFARHHFDFLEKNIGFENISSILEIGPGDGTLLRTISKRFQHIRLSAVEPSGELCKGLEKIPEINVHNCYFEDYPLDDRFDLVIMSHVLEHMKSPVDILRIVHDKLLDDGGNLYIDIPNQDFELCNPEMASLAPQTHFFFFDGLAFPRILRDAGFSPEHIRGAKYSTIPGDYIARMESISELSKAGGSINAIKLYCQKAMRRISLSVSAPVRLLLKRSPEEWPLEKTCESCNNMAFIARK